jgi:hypothetical protein
VVGVFRVGVSAAIQSSFRDAIQILNWGVRNVRKSKRPRNVETSSEAFRRLNHDSKISMTSCCHATTIHKVHYTSDWVTSRKDLRTIGCKFHALIQRCRVAEITLMAVAKRTVSLNPRIYRGVLTGDRQLATLSDSATTATTESLSVKTEIQVWSRERRVKSCQSLAKVERQSYSSHSITFQTLACTVTAFQSSNSQVTVREHSQHYHGLAIGNVTQMLVQLDNQELRCPQYN